MDGIRNLSDMNLFNFGLQVLFVGDREKMLDAVSVDLDGCVATMPLRGP